MLAVGSKAPEFTLPDQNGEMHSLQDYKGKKLFCIFTQRTILRAAQSRRVDTVSIIRRLKKKMQLFLESARIVLHHIRNLKKNRD